VGITTNPTIFANAISHGEGYGEQIAELAGRGMSADEAIFEITTTDVRDACDIMRPVYDATGGVDGRVSIEVSPDLADDTDATTAQAARLWQTVDRPNAFIKIPATKAGLAAITASIAAGISINVTLIFSLARYAEVIEAYLSGLEQAKVLHDAVGRENVLIKIPATKAGLPAITATIAEGISVNVTLIFSLERYRAVMNAYLEGREKAHAAGKDLSKIHSVASFFVSRVDTEIDKRLDAIGTSEARGLKGKAGVANARLAYQAFEEVFSTPRWGSLADEGANPQRPLWASTGVKDPAYPDTLYVTELVAADVVNTMPEKTLEATADHGDIHGDTVTSGYELASNLLDDLERIGVSYTEVVELLEVEGVDKFEKAWLELLDGVTTEMSKVSA
jgi:transaldolase